MKITYLIESDRFDSEPQTGGTDLPGALCVLLQSAGALEQGRGTVYTSAAPEAKLQFAADTEHGVYIGISCKDGVMLSLGDPDALTECIGDWDDEQQISRGLFIPQAAALRIIRRFAETGSTDPDSDWLNAEELPEDGAYII